MTRWASAMGAMVIVVVPLGAAPPTDVAAVFPPGTLAYVELHTPAEVAPSIAALLKGTPLADSIALVHAKKNAAKSFRELQAQQELAAWALWLSPEVLAEVGRLKGLAVGLMGFSDQGEPEWAVAVLTGDSTAAGFAARAFLTTSPTIWEVGKVGQVPIFQHKTPATQPDPNTGQPMLAPPHKPPEGNYEPTFAYTPGLFVAGSSKKAIAPIIERFTGRSTETLRDQPFFAAAATDYRQAGIFFFIDSPKLLAQLDEAGKKRTEPYASEFLAWWRIVANQKAVQWLAGRGQGRDGGLALSVGVALDPAQPSLLRDVLSGSAVKSELLHPAAKPASLAVALTFPEKNRAATLLGVLDSFAKAQGVLGKLPSDYIQQAEEKHLLPLRDELLAHIRAVTIIRTPLQERAKDTSRLPLLVLHLTDAKTATQWEAIMPKLISVIAQDDVAQPAAEAIGAVKVFALPATGLPWKSAIYYARRDTVFVLGQDRQQVAAAVVAEAASSVLGDKPAALPAGDMALVGMASLGELLGMIDLPQSIIVGLPNDLAMPPRPSPPTGPSRAELHKAVDQARQAVLGAFHQLPQARIAVRRQADRIILELFQPEMPSKSLTPIVNAVLDWFEKWLDFHSRSPRRP
ncbi:MAG: hypothetical protein RMJ56_04140 [Gemmataceae bacterium]|nr:hypothetical protein [Gemmata sp.]MDW8196779.1 hypothetical protein [Gemmataceae bacterium]